MSRGKILLAVAAFGVLVILLARGEEPSSRLQVLRDDRWPHSGRIVLTLALVESPRLLPDGVEPPVLSISLRHLGG